MQLLIDHLLRTWKKSTIRIMHALPDFLARSITSFITITPSTKFLPFMNADWVVATNESITLANLAANTFATILYRHPNKDIGRNSPRDVGHVTLGMSDKV
jgi:hypothetical protein